MPRKTRKQKEKAQQRRHEELASKPVLSPTEGLVNREFTFSFDGSASTKLTAEPVKSSDLSRQTIGVRFELSDLVKTLVLATGVFVLELVIYFAWFSRFNN